MMKLTPGYARHPLVQYVRPLDGDFFLAKEAAEELGCSPSVLYNLAQREGAAGYGPSHRASYGDVSLGLYSADRVEKIRTRLAEMGNHSRSGAPLLWSPAERRERRLALERCRADRRRIGEYRARGDDANADRLQALHDKKHARLIEAGTKRRKEITAQRKARRKSAKK